jgi:hypothetical protein
MQNPKSNDEPATQPRPHSLAAQSVSRSKIRNGGGMRLPTFRVAGGVRVPAVRVGDNMRVPVVRVGDNMRVPV